MSVTVAARRNLQKKTIQKAHPDGYYSRVSFFAFLMPCILVMLYIGFRRILEPWGIFAFLHLGFAIFGHLGIQYATNDPGFIPSRFKRSGLTDVTIGAVVFFLAVLIQYGVSKIVPYDITDVEFALYFVFASVSEEIFFRGFLFELAIRKIMKPPTFFKLFILVVLSSAAFAGSHVNYYNNPGMLLSVFLGGILLGIIYLLFRNITINIYGHFLNNVYAVGFELFPQLIIGIGIYTRSVTIPFFLLFIYLFLIPLLIIKKKKGEVILRSAKKLYVRLA